MQRWFIWDWKLIAEVLQNISYLPWCKECFYFSYVDIKFVVSCVWYFIGCELLDTFIEKWMLLYKENFVVVCIIWSSSWRYNILYCSWFENAFKLTRSCVNKQICTIQFHHNLTKLKKSGLDKLLIRKIFIHIYIYFFFFFKFVYLKIAIMQYSIRIARSNVD